MKTILLFFAILVSNWSWAGNRGTPFVVTATEKFQTLLPYAKARVTIDYAISGQLRKPLIVFEGFDAGILTDPDKDQGHKGIEEFITDIINDAEPPMTTPLQVLLQGSLQAPIGASHQLFIKN